jgi:hypothetical protein
MQNAITAPAPRKTLLEQYNERIGSTAVEKLFKGMDTVQRGVMAITVIAMLVSYQHQMHYFASKGAGLGAWFLPLLLDVTMVVLMKVAMLKGIPAANRWIARGLVLIPASVSATVNWVAPGEQVIRFMYAFAVVAIVIGDVAHGLIRPHFAEMEKAVTETAPVVAVNEDVEARRAARREADRARRAAKRLAEQRAADEAAARRALAAERRRETLAAKKAAAVSEPAPVLVPAQPVHVVVPTRPRTGAFGLPRQSLGERVSVLSRAN